VEGHLREALGRRDLLVAVMPGRVHRPNRKPVLAVLTEGGDLIGYAKIGWNDLTRELLGNEARVLRAWARRPPTGFAVPTLLHQGTCGDLELLVTAPVPTRLWRRGRRDAFPPPRTLLEVAGLGGLARSALGESGYWIGVRRRAAAVGAAVAEGPELLEAIDRLEDEHGAARMTFGTCHGDWAPWNMELAAGRLFVWDWERCRDGVPLGFDAVHFRFQTALRKRAVADALARSLRATASTLRAISVEAGQAPLLHRLYLVELLLRLEEGVTDPSTRGPLAAEILASLLSRPSLPVPASAPGRLTVP
jgi:hypothetical protein